MCATVDSQCLEPAWDIYLGDKCKISSSNQKKQYMMKYVISNESGFKIQDGKFNQKRLYFTKGDFVIFGFRNFIVLKKGLCTQNPRISQF